MTDTTIPDTNKSQLVSIHTLSVSNAFSVLNSGPGGLSHEEDKKAFDKEPQKYVKSQEHGSEQIHHH
jgi:hypothetical protein